MLDLGPHRQSPLMPVLQLLRDCETRWSSTYLMIDRILVLWPVSCRIRLWLIGLLTPSCVITQAVVKFVRLHTSASTISKVSLEPHELDTLQDIHDVLEIFHSCQELLSSERTPTVSMVLPAFDELLKSLQAAQENHPELKHFIGVAISKIQDYLDKARKTRIYSLAMGMYTTIYNLGWSLKF